MPLFAVERDLSGISSEQFRTCQQELLAMCTRSHGEGKKVRYISSVVIPADARAFDIFGAETAEPVKDVNEAARAPYVRISQVLDLTPAHVNRTMSRSRLALHDAVAGGSERAVTPEDIGDNMPDRSGTDLTRWLHDGQHVFGLLLQTVEDHRQLQARVEALNKDNEQLNEEVAALRREVNFLGAARAELTEALKASAEHITQLTNQVLQKIAEATPRG